MAGVLVPATNKKLSNFEPVISNGRLEKIFYKLVEKVRKEVPDTVEFATYIQPETEKQKQKYAVFMVKSLHPKQRFKGQELMTVAAMTLAQWNTTERERKHYSRVPDAALSIFAGLLRRHLNERKQLMELID